MSLLEESAAVGKSTEGLVLRIGSILSAIRYKNWSFEVGRSGEAVWLRCSFVEDGHLWHSRKWLVSQHATDSEVIQTVFLAVKTAEEHETREKFLYQGRAIFGPHFDADALWAVSDGEHLDVRREGPR